MELKGQVTDAIREMVMSAVAIPDKASRFLERANRGDVQFQMAGLRDSALLVYAAAQQLLFGLLATSLGALAAWLSDAGHHSLALAAGAASAVFFIALLFSLSRARRLARRLRERPRA